MRDVGGLPDVGEIARTLGPGTTGQSLAERLRSSRQLYARHDRHLCLWNPGIRAWPLTAFEAEHAFGWRALVDLGDDGPMSLSRREVGLPAAPFSDEGCLEGAAMLRRAEALGLGAEALARNGGMSVDAVVQAHGDGKVSAQDQTSMAAMLGFDPWLIETGPADAATIVDVEDVPPGRPDDPASQDAVIAEVRKRWSDAIATKLKGWLDATGLPNKAWGFWTRHDDGVLAQPCVEAVEANLITIDTARMLVAASRRPGTPDDRGAPRAYVFEEAADGLGTVIGLTPAELVAQERAGHPASWKRIGIVEAEARIRCGSANRAGLQVWTRTPRP